MTDTHKDTYELEAIEQTIEAGKTGAAEDLLDAVDFAVDLANALSNARKNNKEYPPMLHP
jgi:hypothetical protein